MQYGNPILNPILNPNIGVVILAQHVLPSVALIAKLVLQFN